MTTQNPGSSNGSTPAVAPVPMLRFREALARVRPEAMALESNDLAQVSLDIPGAIITARGCIAELQALRPRIVAELPSFDVERFDKVETYAFALTLANGDYLSSSAPPMPIAQLTEELKGIRDMLVSDVTAAARRGLVDAAPLNELKGTNGSKNITTDIVTLASLINRNWAKLQGHSALKVEEIERAEQLAETLMGALGTKEQQAARATEAADLRQRVYTLFVKAYDHARRAVIYLRWDEGDADDIAPSLWAGRKQKANNGEEAPAPAPGTQPAPATDITAPIPAPAPAPVATNGGAMPVISPSGPFTNT